MTGFKQYATYSQSADVVYVYLTEAEVASTRTLDDRRLIDHAADGRVVGIEFLEVSGGVDLTDVPFRTAVEALIRGHNFPIFA